MRACAGPFNAASLRNVGLLGSRPGLGSTGGVCREGLLEGTCLSERDRKGRGGQPQLGVSRRESQTLELVNATSSPRPPPDCCLPSWRLKAAGNQTDRQTVHT